MTAEETFKIKMTLDFQILFCKTLKVNSAFIPLKQVEVLLSMLKLYNSQSRNKLTLLSFPFNLISRRSADASCARSKTTEVLRKCLVSHSLQSGAACLPVSVASRCSARIGDAACCFRDGVQRQKRQSVGQSLRQREETRRKFFKWTDRPVVYFFDYLRREETEINSERRWSCWSRAGWATTVSLCRNLLDQVGLLLSEGGWLKEAWWCSTLVCYLKLSHVANYFK